MAKPSATAVVNTACVSSSSSSSSSTSCWSESALLAENELLRQRCELLQQGIDSLYQLYSQQAASVKHISTLLSRPYPPSPSLTPFPLAATTTTTSASSTTPNGSVSASPSDSAATPSPMSERRNSSSKTSRASASCGELGRLAKKHGHATPPIAMPPSSTSGSSLVATAHATLASSPSAAMPPPFQLTPATASSTTSVPAPSTSTSSSSSSSSTSQHVRRKSKSPKFSRRAPMRSSANPTPTKSIVITFTPETESAMRYDGGCLAICYELTAHSSLHLSWWWW